MGAASKRGKRNYYHLRGTAWSLFCRTCYAKWASENLPQPEDRDWWKGHAKAGLLKLSVGSGISAVAWREAVESVVAYNVSFGIHELSRMRIPDAFEAVEKFGGQWIGEAVWV